MSGQGDLVEERPSSAWSPNPVAAPIATLSRPKVLGATPYRREYGAPLIPNAVRGWVACPTVCHMNTTVVVTAMGFTFTLLGAWLGAYWQHRNTRDLQLLDARVRVYGECAANLYEYERVTYSRGKARLDGLPDADRELLRQEAYRNNSSTRAAIGQLSVLSAGGKVPNGFEALRRAIGNLNDSASHADLRNRHDEVYAALDQVLEQARADLVR